MSGKGIVPLTTHQIARVERADRRRADKEKLQQVITIERDRKIREQRG